MHPPISCIQSRQLPQPPIPFPWEATAGFSQRSQKLIRRVSHITPPASFTKNSSHRFANFVCYLRKGCRRFQRGVGIVPLDRSLSRISQKEFSKEGFDQGRSRSTESKWGCLSIIIVFSWLIWKRGNWTQWFLTLMYHIDLDELEISLGTSRPGFRP